MNSKKNSTVNGSKFSLGDKVQVIANIYGDEHDLCLIGIKGTVQEPSAMGCTSHGWVGIHSETYTPYGYDLNFHESELELI